jgi:adenylyltransferase/sulfurtransferase
MTRIDAAAFIAALAAGEAAFDTRSAAVRARDPVPGCEALSLDSVQAGDLPDLDRSAPLLLLCSYGAVSEVVGAYLEAAGFRDVRTVVGGVQALRALRDAMPGTDRR